MGNEIALKALRQALALEREGLGFYQRAAREAQDPQGRQTFLHLSSDEEDHLKMVQAQLRSLRANRGWRSFPQTAGAKAIEAAPPLFPSDKAARLKAGLAEAGERQALLFGLDIENRSFEFYYRSAQETEDAAGREMYSFLAEAERSHFNLLMMRYEGLAGPAGWAH